MTDLLSAIREFRFLEEKRRAGGLAGEDQERWDQLRAILGERAQAPAEAAGPHDWAGGAPTNMPQAVPALAPVPAAEEEPPLVDADLLEDAPVAGPDPPMVPMAPPLVPPPAVPAIAFAGWPMAEEPVAARSEPAEPIDALAGWPMTEEPPAAPTPEPPATPVGWPMAEPVAVAPPPPAPNPEPAFPPAAVAEAEGSRELQSGDEALLSVTEFLAQAPLANAPAPAPPPPNPALSSLPWPTPVIAPAAPAAIAPPEPSAWFAPSAPVTPPAPKTPPEPVPWPEPVVRAERAVWPSRINTAPPWPATPVPPAAAAASEGDPDQDLPVAVEPMAVEPDAMDLLTEKSPAEVKPEKRSGVFVEGEHRVVVHTLVGALKRGTIRDLDLEAHTLELSPQAGGDSEWVNSDELKAIFFMLPPGQPHLAQAGQRLTVTFHDGRQITGFSTDYRPGDPGFFLIPADTRSATARIYVFRAALRDVMAN